MDCSTGPLSFLHVNVSGGEPDELQVNVILDPRTMSTAANDDDDMPVITGAAVHGNAYNN